MKELVQNFEGRGEVKGFNFKQILVSDKSYLYEVTNEFNNIHYEIFERKENHQFDCVSYPKSNSFGIWATTTRDYNIALEKFNEYNNKEKTSGDIEIIEEADEDDTEDINEEIE